MHLSTWFCNFIYISLASSETAMNKIKVNQISNVWLLHLVACSVQSLWTNYPVHGTEHAPKSNYDTLDIWLNLI